MKALIAQVRAETYMTLRRGETVLLTIAIPVAFLLFFSSVKVIETPTARPVDFYLPGVLALAVMSTSMVSLGIATGFERGYGVLKRLGATPLGRPRLLAAKIITVIVVEVVQSVVLVTVGVALGWRMSGSGTALVEAIGVALLASIAFGGIGLVMAGSLKAELNLAAANGLYLVLLLLGGMVVPLGKLPGVLGTLSRALPSAALSSALRAALSSTSLVPAHSWIVLGVWALVAPGVAAATFRWE